MTTPSSTRTAPPGVTSRSLVIPTTSASSTRRGIIAAPLSPSTRGASGAARSGRGRRGRPRPGRRASRRARRRTTRSSSRG
ncbi:hypothetical protein FBQ97_17315 [Acidobacteria bacterium ACD]|nr:hypothetical protein [Acidobacteria bacterium ACD]